jgi:uncharacterized protein YjbI with pentapeptide repeats
MIRIQLTFLFQIGIIGVLTPFIVAQTTGSRSILRAREFIENPLLLAHARQTVVLDNEPNPLEEPVIRYELEEGPHNFCLSGIRTDFTGIVLKEMFGDKVFKMPSYERCTRVDLSGGIYQLHFLHSGKQQPDSNRSIRVQVDPPSPPLADSNGNPVAGYWAIEMDPAIDPQHKAGRLRAQPPFQDLLKDGYAYGPVIADFSSSVMDEYSLFHVINNSTFYDGAILQGGQDTYWSLVSGGFPFNTDYVLIGSGCKFVACSGSYTQSHVKDLGNNNFQLFYQNSPFFFSDQGYSPSELTVKGADEPPATFHVVFRFFPNGTQIGNLHPGEAALFQTCGYKDRAAVFAYGAADLTAVTSAATTIDNSAKSIRLGNNTAVLWRTASSQLIAITADTACLPAGSAEPSGHDFEVLPLDTLLSDSGNGAALDKKCINCKLQGADLVNLNLEDWNFSGADLSGATLTNTNLYKVKLDGAVLTGTKLPCVDFSGVDQNHPTDLTSVDFSKVQWVQTNGCKSNFKYTLLSVAKLPPSMWKDLDLSYATFVDAEGQQLSSEMHPLDLRGVSLVGVSLEGAILDYATGLSGADLTQAILSRASLQHVNLSNANLNGAQLNSANLDGANLSDAHLIKPSPGGDAANLQGAYLRNVNLSGGKLDGANFTNASFYSSAAVGLGSCNPDPNTGFTNGCATASHATMDLTKFNGAYLFGVDFTSATVQGVNFGNSFLTGANFGGAVLSADTSGSETGFSGAFLQGTNLSGVTLQNGISLQDAFVDFRPAGNTISLILNGYHTAFPGYWNTPGQSVCAQMAYSNPTGVPETDEHVTCPDGFRYPQGCGAASAKDANPNWKSGVDITQFASYKDKATYTPEFGDPICAFDRNWIPFIVSRPVPGPGPGPKHRPHHKPGRGERQ